MRIVYLRVQEELDGMVHVEQKGIAPEFLEAENVKAGDFLALQYRILTRRLDKRVRDARLAVPEGKLP